MTVLGAVSFRHADQVAFAAVVVPTTKALDLLRLLVGAGEVALGAGHYIGLLWPEADEARGRMSLRTALSQLRRALGPEVVQRHGDLLRLGEVETDVSRLRSGAEHVDRLRREGDDRAVLDAVDDLERCWGADLVVSDGSCEAVFALREELRALRSRLLLDAAAAAHRLGRARESLALALSADALASSESTARALMTAWAALGETRRAIEVFEGVRTGLELAYGVQPSAATRATYLQVVTSGDDPDLSLVEHHREAVAELADLVVRLSASDQRGGVVWVLGEPGAGRTHVARQAVRVLQQVSPPLASVVRVRPEVVALDQGELRRLHQEAQETRSVLLVPVREPVGDRGARGEVEVRVERLARADFRDLLRQLLQEEPSAALEQRLWVTTGGLAGLATRTVGSLLGHDSLCWGPGQVWWPGSVDAAPA